MNRCQAYLGNSNLFKILNFDLCNTCDTIFNIGGWQNQLINQHLHPSKENCMFACDQS